MRLSQNKHFFPNHWQSRNPCMRWCTHVPRRGETGAHSHWRPPIRCTPTTYDDEMRRDSESDHLMQCEVDYGLFYFFLTDNISITMPPINIQRKSMRIRIRNEEKRVYQTQQTDDMDPILRVQFIQLGNKKGEIMECWYERNRITGSVYREKRYRTASIKRSNVSIWSSKNPPPPCFVRISLTFRYTFLFIHRDRF